MYIYNKILKLKLMVLAKETFICVYVCNLSFPLEKFIHVVDCHMQFFAVRKTFIFKACDLLIKQKYKQKTTVMSDVIIHIL